MISTILQLAEGLRHRSRTDEHGASLLEYVLLLSFIAIALIAAVTLFGSNLGIAFGEAGSSLDTLP